MPYYRAIGETLDAFVSEVRRWTEDC